MGTMNERLANRHRDEFFGAARPSIRNIA